MACIYPCSSQSPEILYPYLNKTVTDLITPESDWVANAANAAAAIGFLVEKLNWAGFYLLEGKELVLGPFWGKPAVTRIPFGKGVCGDSALARKTIVVPDVHQHPGHIACDLYSNSEIVIPLLDGERLIGVLDIDSPEIDRFSQADQEGLEAFAKLLSGLIHFPKR